jgi:hypothetical protein
MRHDDMWKYKEQTTPTKQEGQKRKKKQIARTSL